MSYILVPPPEAFFGLPMPAEQILAGGTKAYTSDQLTGAIENFRAQAALLTQSFKSPFSREQLDDFVDRPTIAIIADGATIHSRIRTGAQREIQADRSRKAFELGKMFAAKGWRAVLPGDSGLCRNVIEGVVEGGGQYVVAMTRRSLTYDDKGNPILPKNTENGIYIVTNTPAEMKSILFALSDSLVYLNGGKRTLDIFTDHYVLEQTGRHEDFRLKGGHKRKLVLLNDDGAWNPMAAFVAHGIDAGFALPDHKKIMNMAKSTNDVISQLSNGLYDGAPWTKHASPAHLFVPSKAITLADFLSRERVMQQIQPTGTTGLLRQLKEARTIDHKLGALDEEIQIALARPTALVFCASKPGHDPQHMKATFATGAAIRRAGYTMVNGGGSDGNMGAINNGYSRAASLEKPFTFAVTPFAFLQRTGQASSEGAHDGVNVTIATPGMNDRKMIMGSLANEAPSRNRPGDIHMMLTGFLGTLDEMTENIALDIDRNYAALSVNGYWNGFSELFKPGIEAGYTSREELPNITLAETADEMEAILLRKPGAEAKSIKWPQLAA